MDQFFVVGFAVFVFGYLALQITLHTTQSKREPPLVECTIPFLDSAIGIAIHRAKYLFRLGYDELTGYIDLFRAETFRTRYGLPIYTLRMPFQRLYVVHDPHIIQSIQNKSNAATFIPNLLDFGMLFSGLNSQSRKTLRKAFGLKGNGFTMSVHKYLLAGPSLKAATRAAVDRLSTSLPNSLKDANRSGLQEFIRHELTLALTGAVYGPENPYDDPVIEASWSEFVPGITHLLYSPFPSITARKSLQARSRVIEAFQRYFETGGHLQAFPMISEMHDMNKGHGLTSDEAAKMEMATSLAMLSSGAITTFWLLYHILSDAEAIAIVRAELATITIPHTEPMGGNTISKGRIVDLSEIKERCPTLVALLNETLRYHSSVINIKEVQHDTTLADQYLLKKKGIVMIPGQSVHHSKTIWGPDADKFDFRRFLNRISQKNISSTSAFRPFGAGVTMCPGRHFSTNVILSFTAMVLLQRDIVPEDGKWSMPTKYTADLWNAMPKPDSDILVRFEERMKEAEIEWKFVWGKESGLDNGANKRGFM